MTSWRRGHTCQQHLTTTQPSRPSKARSVQWLQLFCTQHCHPGGGAVVHSWFLFFEDLALWLQGSLPPILPCLSENDVLPKTSTRSTFILCSPSFLFFSFFFFLPRAGSVMFTSLKLIFWLKVKTDPVWGFYASHSMMLIPREGKGNISRCRWKKCNVYCCTIFSNKRTQNLFVIFFFWSSWWDFSFATCPSPAACV